MCVYLRKKGRLRGKLTKASYNSRFQKLQSVISPSIIQTISIVYFYVMIIVD